MVLGSDLTQLPILKERKQPALTGLRTNRKLSTNGRLGVWEVSSGDASILRAMLAGKKGQLAETAPQS
jgi:hypothetical protein